MPKKMFVKLHTGYAGMDGYEIMEFPDNITEDEINEEVFWRAVEHAGHYGIVMCDDGCEDENCGYEHPGSTNIEGYAVPYVPEKHDMYL